MQDTSCQKHGGYPRCQAVQAMVKDHDGQLKALFTVLDFHRGDLVDYSKTLKK